MLRQVRLSLCMRFFAPLLAVLCSTPVFAAATDWQQVAPDTMIRLISSDQLTADGKLLAGIEIDMPQSYKTYWRVPGESGIPTMVEFTGSTGLGAHRILWPLPVIDQSQGFLDFVYHGPTLLPLELSPEGGALDLELQVVMGVCSDICVPVRATFSLPVDLAKPDAGQGLRLTQALADVPLPAPDNAVVGEVTESPAGLVVPLLDTGIDPASIVAAVDDPEVLIGAPQKSPDSGIIVLPVLGGDGQQSLVGQSIEISYMTPAGPYMVVRKIAAGGST